jgi:hypothetical protein
VGERDAKLDGVHQVHINPSGNMASTFGNSRWDLGWAWATRRAGMAILGHDGANYEEKSVDELRTLNQKSSGCRRWTEADRR